MLHVFDGFMKEYPGNPNLVVSHSLIVSRRTEYLSHAAAELISSVSFQYLVFNQTSLLCHLRSVNLCMVFQSYSFLDRQCPYGAAQDAWK